MLIACASFALASASLRGTGWPAHSPRRGLAMLLAIGLAYTVFSEWRNVYPLSSWAYAGAMPTLWGIGLAPILQWLFMPALTLGLQIRIRRVARSSRSSSSRRTIAPTRCA